MHSTIDRRFRLNDILQLYGAHELYAEEDFSLDDEAPKLVVLIKNKQRSAGLLLDMSNLFYSVVGVHITTNPHSLCLGGLKIVWRDGNWYV